MDFLIRNCDIDVHIKFNWHRVCPFASLPVLRLVCTTNTLGLEDEISNPFQVSLRFLYLSDTIC